MASSGTLHLRLHSITQGDVFTSFDIPADDKATRKWHEALTEHAKKTWLASGKEGTIQSFPYVGTRWRKGQIPPALWTSAHFSDGDIIPDGTREFKVMVREPSGAIKVPPSVGALINHYFPAGKETLAVFTFVP